MEIKIGNRVIGNGCKPFIVAEAGINHNGDIEKALEMVRIASSANVDAIKFQTFKAEEFVNDSSLMYTYKSEDKEITEPLMDILKRSEFTTEEWFRIKKECDKQKILFFSTAQNRTDLELLLELNVPAIKVGSDDFTNIPLLKDYSKTGLPIIISCGMSDLGEIYETLSSLGSFNGYPTILLHTTSLYPTSASDANLFKIKTLKNIFPSIPVGFSDHTIGHRASSIAIGLGACLVEKHFTLNHDLPGPDHWFAEDPSGLLEWVNSINESFKMLGNGVLEPTSEEQKMKEVARRSIVAIQDIRLGEKLNESNIGLRRPGYGLPPRLILQIFGMIATRNIKKGTLLNYGDFGNE